VTFLVLENSFGGCRIQPCDTPEQRHVDTDDEWEVGRAETLEAAETVRVRYIKNNFAFEDFHACPKDDRVAEDLIAKYAR